MGKATSGRVVWSLIAGLLATALIASCGSSTSPKPGDDDGAPEGGDISTVGDAGEGLGVGGSLTAGRSGAGAGGTVGSGGRGATTAGSGGRSIAGSGGASGGSGGSAGTAGTPMIPGCRTGVPCKCGKAVGVTVCEDDEESCSCPPQAECTQEEPEACFEACGGEPFGAWVLVDTCFGGSTGEEGECRKNMRGTADFTEMRLRILDGGELTMRGEVEWDLDVAASLECLNISTTDHCQGSNLVTSPLVFTTFGTLACEANACGVCDCSGPMTDAATFLVTNWQRHGNKITLGATVDYCVDGDEMWVGGTDNNGRPMVSYKFKKESCVGTPTACGARTPEECDKDGSCVLGRCVATSGTQAHCATGVTETQCNVIQGCDWDPDACTGEATPRCEFDRCDRQPGCSWGEPTARCGGEVLPCEHRERSQCNSSSCTPTICHPGGLDTGDCSLLTATECATAPGCTVAGTACTGTPRCSTQTNGALCNKLGCSHFEVCEGTAEPCSTLSVANCHDAPGCRIEW